MSRGNESRPLAAAYANLSASESSAIGMLGIVVTPRKYDSIFCTDALFSLPQSSKFFHSLSITSIFNHLHGVLNVGKKITNYTV
jgi:hypothetical protein